MARKREFFPSRGTGFLSSKRGGKKVSLTCDLRTSEKGRAEGSFQPAIRKKPCHFFGEANRGRKRSEPEIAILDSEKGAKIPGSLGGGSFTEKRTAQHVSLS